MQEGIKTKYNLIGFKPINWFFYLIIIAISVSLLATPYYKYAILPGIIILLLLLLGHNPKLGYYLIVFLIPFGAYTSFSGQYQFLTISKFVGLWIVIIILFKLLLNKRNNFNINSNLWSWFIIFFVISLISALMSPYPLTSFDNIRKLLIAYIFFGLSLIFINDRDFYKTLPVILILSISISSLLSIIGYAFDIPLFVMSVKSIKRAIGLSPDPNLFSSMILFSLPILLYWFFSSDKLLGKIMAALLFIINSIAIILTYSRGGAIVFGVLLIFLIISSLKRFRPKYLGFVILVTIITTAVILALVPPSYWERQKGMTDTSDRSIGARTSYLYAGWDAFKENPIIGSGPGTFRDIYAVTSYAQYYGLEREVEEGYRRFAHNSYIEVLVGTGILGFTTFLIILFITFRNFFLAKKHFLLNGQEKMASLVGAYSLSFISIIIYYFIISSTYNKYFWLSLALSQIAYRVSQEIHKDENIPISK